MVLTPPQRSRASLQFSNIAIPPTEISVYAYRWRTGKRYLGIPRRLSSAEETHQTRVGLGIQPLVVER
jgi:hypothetical protein